MTDIRVRADAKENHRRIEEEDRKLKRAERLHQESITSGSRNAAVEMRWADLYDINMPQELYKVVYTTYQVRPSIEAYNI